MSNRSVFLIRSMFMVVGLVLLAGLSLPATALADPPGTGNAQAEPCAACHGPETQAWQASPHAKDKINCEACHGPYKADHPQKSAMLLDVEANTCKACHVETTSEWKSSHHARVGVQCIGCHLSHSQKFRLTDIALCGSCHRSTMEDFTHTAHKEAGVICADCHLSSRTSHVTTTPAGQVTAPSHTFTVASEACVGCHGQTIHELTIANPVTNAQKLALAEQVPALNAKIQTLEEDNKRLQSVAVINLGVGLGVGGMLGIILMLAFAYIERRSRQ